MHSRGHDASSSLAEAVVEDPGLVGRPVGVLALRAQDLLHNGRVRHAHVLGRPERLFEDGAVLSVIPPLEQQQTQ